MDRPMHSVFQTTRDALTAVRESDLGPAQTFAERWQSDAIGQGSNRGSRWPARSALATIALGLLASGAMANWMWLPREQVTFSADPLEGANTEGGAPGRSSGVLWHQTFRTWEPDSGPNHAIGYYVRVGPDWDVAGAWASNKEPVTFFQADSGHRTTDLDIAVDEDDDVYLVAEIFNVAIHPPGGDPCIGYRHRGTEGWSAQYLVSPSPSSYGFNTPQIALQETEDGDTLHVTFRRSAVDSSGPRVGLWYTRKATADAEDAWDEPIFVTATITAASVAIDPEGDVHFFGKHNKIVGEIDSAYVWEFVGTYSGGEWASLDSVVVSRHAGPAHTGLSVTTEEPPPTGDVEQESGVFYWVWSGPTGWNGSPSNDLFSATRSASGVWSIPDTLTAIDSLSAYTADLVRSANGTWHLIYNEPGVPPGLNQLPSNQTEIRHRQSEDFVAWTGAETVTFEQRTLSFDAEVVALQDTLFVTYTSHDDDEPTPGSDGDYEVWSQKGFALADSVSGTTETWRGAVYLDRDVVVKSGATLTIEAGTRIFARANTDLSQEGEDDGRVEIVVLGTLVSQGTAAAPIEFGSFGGVGAPGEWYGIRTPDPDRIEGDYVTIRNALGGISLQSAGFPDFADLTSRGFEFEDNVNDVTIDRDVVIPVGLSVTIPAGWSVGFGPGDSVNQGRDATRTEVVVLGTLTVDGSAGSPVTLQSVTGTSGGWYGLRTPDAEAKILGQNVVLRHALGALALEESPGALPDFANLTSRGFVFEENSSDVSIDRDVVIAALDSVFVPAGWRLGFGPGDAVNQGRHPDHAELIVRGKLGIQGVSGNRVRLGALDPTVGPWAGLLFDQLATVGAPSGYGYCASYVNNAEIAHATTGIAIRQSGAPSLVRPIFEEIENDRGVVLDSSDVYVPKGGVWDLLAPTTIKVALATRSGAEIGSRNPGKVDIVVHGLLLTSGASPDFVKFEPVQVPIAVATGEEWGGILIDWPAPLNPPTLFSHADVGYAITPIWSYFHRPIIEHSRIHHFRDQALRLQYSPAGVGPELRYNSVFRDTTGTAPLVSSAGKTGVVLNNVPDGNIQENTISLSGMQNDGGAALFVQNTAGKFGFCATTGSGDTLQVVGNELLGPGGGADTGNATWSAIHGDWMCSVSGRKVLVTDNVINGWNEAGIKLNQSADLQFTCNTVTNCAKALEFTRNSDPEGSAVRFRTNVLRIGAYGIDNDQPVFRTDNALMLQLGPTVNKGKNQLIADGDDRYGYENDGSSNTLNAEQNLWKQVGDVQTSQALILDDIRTETTYPVLVSVASPQEEIPDLCSASSAQPESARERADAPGSEPMSSGGDVSTLPVATELAVKGPQLGRADIRFSLAGGESRRVEIDVFDVAGRRVKRLVSDDLPGGRYGISWDGVSDQGDRVSAGVYLVRMRAGEERDVRKLVLLR